jgi:hypothetical protein
METEDKSYERILLYVYITRSTEISLVPLWFQGAETTLIGL